MSRSLSFFRRRETLAIFQAVAFLVFVPSIHSFASIKQRLAALTEPSQSVLSSSSQNEYSVSSIEEASRILSEWDSKFNPDISGEDQPIATESMISLRSALEPSIRLLSNIASNDRNEDPTQGRLILGICATSAPEGVATLKAWVTELGLPRGLLHGMDKDGVPLDLSGAVYIKYNSGGVYTFSDIRKSGLGFDALWKPGDALLELYDGTYRGVYFQVELQDEEFRQYLVPLDVF